MDDAIIRHIWGGGTGETLIHPAAILFLAVCGILILVLERDKAFAVFAIAGLLIPMSQKAVFLGLNFTALRILIIAAWARLFFRMEIHTIRMTAIDKVFIFWALSNVIAFVLLWQTWGALVNRLGFLLDAAGIYFLCRQMISDQEQMDRAVSALAVISVILVLIMGAEQVTGRNPVAFLGGMEEITTEREGVLRSQGPFAHPITAGTFGAVLIPLLASMWWKPAANRTLIMAGIIASALVTLLSFSSGPFLAMLAGIAALFLSPWRHRLKWLKWGVLSTLVILHLIMKAPVWALIDRVGVFAGSSSYHRFTLVDQFIRRFDEWWLLGTKSTNHWGWMMWDTVNQFVGEGIRGGLLTFILFIVMLTLCFRAIGSKMDEVQDNRPAQMVLWATGSALVAHTVSFFGIAYFDQMILPWYFLIAMISMISGLEAYELSPTIEAVREYQILENGAESASGERLWTLP